MLSQRVRCKQNTNTGLVQHMKAPEQDQKDTSPQNNEFAGGAFWLSLMDHDPATNNPRTNARLTTVIVKPTASPSQQLYRIAQTNVLCYCVGAVLRLLCCRLKHAPHR
jgi:hypothetical protein